MVFEYEYLFQAFIVIEGIYIISHSFVLLFTFFINESDIEEKEEGNQNLFASLD